MTLMYNVSVMLENSIVKLKVKMATATILDLKNCFPFIAIPPILAKLGGTVATPIFSGSCRKRTVSKVQDGGYHVFWKTAAAKS